MTIKIDPELRALIPPLSLEELVQLTENCINEGIRDEICIWENIIIDGHNRFDIAEEHGLDYKTKEYDFETREEAKLWMCQNQLGRRNLQPIDKIPLVEELEKLLREQAKERQIRKPSDNSVRANLHEQNSRTDEKLAKQIGVGQRTFHDLKKVHHSGTDELKETVRSKRVGASTAALISELPEEGNTFLYVSFSELEKSEAKILWYKNETL